MSNSAISPPRRVTRWHQWSDHTTVRTEVYLVTEYSTGEIVVTLTDHSSKTTTIIDGMTVVALAILDRHCPA